MDEIKHETESDNVTDESQSWSSSLKDPNLKSLVESKKWKSVEEALHSYANLEKYLGVPKDKLLRLPDENTFEAMEEVFNKLGRPQTPEEYGLVPKDEKSKQFTEEFSKFSHKIGLTKAQVEALDSWAQEVNDKLSEDSEKEFERSKEIEDLELKKDWGSQYEKNLSQAKLGAKTVGADESIINAIERSVGYKKTMDFFLNIGRKLGEDTFRTGRNESVIDPAAAKRELDSLINDKEFMKRIFAGDREAIERHHRLVKATL